MHCIDVGVTKRMILCHMSKKKRFFESVKNCNIVMNDMKNFKFPKEIPRNPRCLKNVNKFKANEFSFFLLYIAPLIYHNRMASAHYSHFFSYCFFIGNLLKKNISKKLLNFCRVLIQNFVRKIVELYDISEMTINVHLLLHLPEMIKQVGSLSCIDSYFFEDMNRILKAHTFGSTNIIFQAMFKNNIQFSIYLDSLSTNSQISNTNFEKKLKIRKPLETQFKKLFKNHKNIPKFQFSTFKCNDKYLTSETYEKKKKSCNYVVKFKRNFFFIHCFVMSENEIYAIGRFAMKTSNPQETISIHRMEFEMKIDWIHEVKLDKKFHILKIDALEQKVGLYQRDSQYFCIDLFYSSAF